MYLHFDMFEKILKMAPTQRQVDFPFIFISKEEREMDIEKTLLL
jgi:hypothetical protein